MSFLDDYEPVQPRLQKFWADHPKGRVTTHREDAPDGEFVFTAAVYRDGDTEPFATGWAREIVGQGNVNRTSALENCETSAVGRALANAGYAPSPNRASREEMAKTVPADPISDEQAAQLRERIESLEDAGVEAKQAWKDAGLPKLAVLPADRFPEAVAILDQLNTSLDEEPF